MLSETAKANIRLALDCLRNRVPNFRDRRPQRVMIAEVAKTLAQPRAADAALDGGNILCIEAGTGTGKTVGYLLSAIPVAQEQKKKVIISSATVVLQEQIVRKDLPLVAEHSGLSFTYALAKGRGRYLCERNLHSLLDMLGGDHPGLFGHPLAEAEIRLLTQMAAQFPHGWSGDRDAWPDAVPDTLWAKISNDRHSCTGKTCAFQKQCPFFQARATLNEADVIVANHDLVLSDFALGGGVILPDPTQCLYVLDEGHHLPDVARERFAASMTVRGAISWLEDVGQVAGKVALLLGKPHAATLAGETETDAQALVNLLYQLGAALDRLEHWTTAQDPARARGQGEENTLLFPEGRIPDWLRELGDNIQHHVGALEKRIRKLKDQLEEAIDNKEIHPSQTEKPLADIGFLSGRLENAHQLWRLMLHADDPDRPPTARWITRLGNPAAADYLLSASPSEAAGVLLQQFWPRMAGAVVTSATLRSLGSFDYFARETGLARLSKVRYVALDTPFDYASQGEILVPELASDPRSADDHTQEIAALLPQLLRPEEGSLVLFTSRLQMERVAGMLPQEWRERTLLQGEKGKAETLRLHAERVSRGEGSVLFGLDSYGEGLDLQGELASCVVICKLPFQVPTDPISATRRAWLVARGGNPFMELVVPAASRKLNQQAGRLIRTESDRGRLIILDRRLLTMRYGQALLKALPPFRQRLARQSRAAG